MYVPLEDQIVDEILNVAGDETRVFADILSSSGTDGTRFAPEETGGMLEGCRQYLLMVANEVIGPALRAKVGASDLVQDTFLEAQRHLNVFRGRSKAELRAWLRKILEGRLANVRRSYLTTEKRATHKEVAIETLLIEEDGKDGALACRLPSPSSQLLRSEWAATLEEALQRLPTHYRRTLAWRYQDQLPWDEIGRRMDCTADAARKVWSRAILQLRRELARRGSMP